MRSPGKRRPAFTLIELLIVVAIIAILALIAVPNFLEAQVRAKVSRVRTDMRSLATALEAYFVDWNSYTFYDPAEYDDYYQPPVRAAGWTQITTPVAYITSIPNDPFGSSEYMADFPGRGSFLPPLYELGTGAVGVGRSGTRSSPQDGMPSNTWEMNSSGPDKRDNTNNPARSGGQYSWSDSSFPWVSYDFNDPAVIVDGLALLYDPTNGTISRGEIFRFGGMKPPGTLWDIWYSVGSGK
jgi:prepilin-type N-terminal cleavage/methylation domain-containing protein